MLSLVIRRKTGRLYNVNLQRISHVRTDLHRLQALT